MPLTAKGQKIMANMQRQYGPEKGERVFYASRNAGRITGVDPGHQFGGAVNPRFVNPYSIGYGAVPSYGGYGYGGNFAPGGFGFSSFGAQPSMPAAAPATPSVPSAAPMQVATGRFARGGTTGLIDHDFDPDLPRGQDAAQLIPVLPEGALLEHLQDRQRLLNTMMQREALRRYWLGGYVPGYWLGGWVV